MLVNSKIVDEDLKRLTELEFIDWNKLNDSVIFVTGATGLIGETLVKSLLYQSKIRGNNIKLVCSVRNIEKAKKMFAEYMQDSNLVFCVGDINEKIVYEDKIDYIIHGASVTSSKMFVEKPVDTIMTAINGTTNVLEFAMEKQVKSMVYLSTMEVYGTPKTDDKVAEKDYAYMDHLNVRSSYPESKQMVECLCASYCKQYNVPVKIARLTQTFGPGIDYNDGRVFAEFARCVIENRDIVLHTKGETKRNYLYTFDAVSAILTILLAGSDAEAYNVANENTYCSILEMAEMVATINTEGKVQVKIEIEDESKFGYAPVLKMNLDTSKLKSLGWKAEIELEGMFRRMIETLKKE